jgi:hypothetical protein
MDICEGAFVLLPVKIVTVAFAVQEHNDRVVSEEHQKVMAP